MNMTTVIDALHNIFKGEKTIEDIFDDRIEKGTYINQDIDNIPWMGLFKGSKAYEPHTMGSGNFQASGKIRIIIQVANIHSAEDCSDDLESAVKAVVDVVNNSRTISDTVDRIVRYMVDYEYDETDRGDMHFQAAMITIEVEKQ